MAKKRANRKSYPGHLLRRGAGWRWQVRIKGQRHQIRFEVRTKEEAEELAREEYDKLVAIARRHDGNVPAPIRMSELFAEFEELDMPAAEGAQDAYRDSLRVFREYFVELRGDPRADRVTGPDVMRFLDWRKTHKVGKKRKKPISPRTVAKDRTVLHRIFNRAERRGYVDHNPVASTDVPKGDPFEPVILSDDEFEKLLDACRNPMVRLYVLTLAEAGGRSESEILWLRWEDADLDGGFLNIRSRRDGHRTKSGKSRHTPMTLRLQLAMREHVATYRDRPYADGPSPWVFHHLLTQRHHGAGERVKTFYDAIKGAARRASLPLEFRPHDLRHRRVTKWIAEGKDVTLIKEAVGHADLRTTMGYTHLAKEHLRALVEDRAPSPARPVLHREHGTP